MKFLLNVSVSEVLFLHARFGGKALLFSSLPINSQILNRNHKFDLNDHSTRFTTLLWFAFARIINKKDHINNKKVKVE